jgi:hypothetical protein
MPIELFYNNIQTNLAGPLSNVATTAALTAGAGALFSPAPVSGQYFRATLNDAATGLIYEVVYVTGVSGDVITMQRGREGTTAEAWLSGDIFVVNVTAGGLQLFQQTLVNAGNPNSSVAGTAAGGGIAPTYCWDTVNNIQWACVISGPAATAFWVPASGIFPISRTIWIRTDGNDANNGSANNSANAVLTFTRAFALAGQSYVPGGSVAIQMGNTGTYVAASPPNGLNTPLSIIGDAANQDSYIIAGAGTNTGVIIVQNGTNVTFNGCRLNNNNNVTNLLAVLNGGSVTLSNVTAAATGTGNTQAAILTFPGGSITLGSGNKCVSNFGWYLLARGGAITVNSGVTVTMSGTPAFATATVASIDGGQLLAAGSTWSGGVTATRYSATVNGIIDTGSGGANFFPGTGAGSTATGGQYV